METEMDVDPELSSVMQIQQAQHRRMVDRELGPAREEEPEWVAVPEPEPSPPREEMEALPEPAPAPRPPARLEEEKEMEMDEGDRIPPPIGVARVCDPNLEKIPFPDGSWRAIETPRLSYRPCGPIWSRARRRRRRKTSARTRR